MSMSDTGWLMIKAGVCRVMGVAMLSDLQEIMNSLKTMSAALDQDRSDAQQIVIDLESRIAELEEEFANKLPPSTEWRDGYLVENPKPAYARAFADLRKQESEK